MTLTVCLMTLHLETNFTGMSHFCQVAAKCKAILLKAMFYFYLYSTRIKINFHLSSIYTEAWDNLEMLFISY